jgi:hypothetical protein
MGLKFDKNALANEILKNLEKEFKWVFQAWENEVISKMRNSEFQKNADIDFELRKESRAIIAYLKANTYVLADSYGTGSLALVSNPGYQAYRNSNRWNPSRTSRAIMGRPEGDYTDVFGRKRHSSGALEGQNIEGWKLTRGKFTLKVEPVSPSYALQMAHQWLYKTYLPRAYSNAVKATNFAKYLIES